MISVSMPAIDNSLIVLRKTTRSYNNRKRYFSQSTRTFSVNSDGDPCSVRCARIDEGVREGNSGACLQHVWPLAKEVGKRGGNNRHDRKFVWVVVRIKSLAIRQPATAHTRTPPILLNHRHLPPRMTNESGRLNFSLLRCFFHHRVAWSLPFRTFIFSLSFLTVLIYATPLTIHGRWPGRN